MKHVPLQVVQAAIANKISAETKVLDWSTNNVVKWLKDIQMDSIVQNVINTSLDGKKLMSLPVEYICSGLDLG